MFWADFYTQTTNVQKYNLFFDFQNSYNNVFVTLFYLKTFKRFRNFSL